jgi:PPK2 family polyphosphate:nucleotide phosphotransferase
MKRYRVEPGSAVRLGEWKSDDRRGFDGTKEDANAKLLRLGRRLELLQEKLYAQRRHKVLVVLQAMDTGGKDGVIRHVFDAVNPQGVRVVSFKAPSQEELDHDYLWRAHRQVPGRGEIVIFNRSHYEDVLIVRVHGLVPAKVWKRRYDQINDFERMLSEEGTTIIKFFLHIGRDEQKRRLQSRLDEPEKHWKFNLDDVAERSRWGDYTKAYEAVLTRTSTPWAPWHIVPGDAKWYRNLVVATLIVDALSRLRPEFPPAPPGLDEVKIPD